MAELENKKCSICGKDTFYDGINYEHNKCIFHCNKNDEAIWGEGDNKDAKLFWMAIREQIKSELSQEVAVKYQYEDYTEYEDVNLRTHDFRQYIFPAFEWHPKSLILDTKQTVQTIYKEEFCFWIFNQDDYVEKKFNYGVNFNDAIFQYLASFNNTLFCGFHDWFGGAKFIKNAHFDYSDFDTDYSPSINYCELKQAAYFNIKNTKCGFDFNETIFHDDCNIFIQNTSLDSELVFNEAIFKKTLFLKCDTLVKKLVFDSVIFDDKSFIFMQNLSCNTFILENVQNRASNIKITNLVINENFTIKNSMLNNIEFNGLNLENTKTIILENTSFIGSHLTNVKWGIINNDRFKIDRQMARQLKSINDAQGETIIANDFYALEMKLRSKELKWRFGHISEKIIQNIHGLISNHSNDWILPILWFFICGFFFANIANQNTIIASLPLPIAFIYGVYKADNWSILSYYKFTIACMLYGFLIFCTTGFNVELLAAIVNPLNLKDSKNLLDNTNLVVIYLCRLIEIFIGYQVVTSIRKNTKRK